MGLPQSGIFASGANAHSLTEFELSGNEEASRSLARVARLALDLGTIDGINLVVGVRPSLFMHVTDIPDLAEDFSEPVRGVEGFEMPATQADIWLWIAGGSQDHVFDKTRAAITSLHGAASAIRTVSGWSYRGNRDLTGFEDGTENPPASEAAQVALIAEPERLAGSSIALVQRWKHDLDAFAKLNNDAQESVIGRTKADSIEFDDEVMPSNAHVARVSLKAGGETLAIYRRSVPYGDALTYGLAFVAFTHDQGHIALMLASMAGETDGTRDALTSFTHPESGAYYFVPSMDLLSELAQDP